MYYRNGVLYYRKCVMYNRTCVMYYRKCVMYYRMGVMYVLHIGCNVLQKECNVLQKGSQRADEYIRLIRDTLDEAVAQCIEAAGHEWEPSKQKMLLRVSH